ncbi:cytochrome aa3-600 menaquinol oxidase subunit 4 [Lentibacillus halodurans]|uniref:Cytochrome aa3-600 menaquinol oxidase subunit 4 n=1 Tax=Lentibacillus halodurans TaxID=237679 RepID=A0A1I0Z981_9BACI|nr:cytochrome C oxidase subunit IV family protein [Lentibacillus halodurans]SFB22091.1 cytochrome aa3-600 menaquinol oxidase subunit 4 [Lentibacillus halodurans]
MANRSKRIPIQHVVGYVMSIVLTVLAAWAALNSNLPVIWIIILILALAVIQAGIQLFMFMHIIERGTGHAPWQMIFHGFILAAIVVAGSLFTMSFGFNHDHNDDGGHEQHEQHEQE